MKTLRRSTTAAEWNETSSTSAVVQPSFPPAPPAPAASAMNRRLFLRTGLKTAPVLWSLPRLGAAAAAAPLSGRRPVATHGTASGDVESRRAVLWSRADRPARMWAELSADPEFRRAETLRGGFARPENGFGAHAFPENLLPGTRYYYRIRFRTEDGRNTDGPAETGTFRTAPEERADIRFCWSGDTVGQGFGIDPSRGGMRTYAAIRERRPDFLVHCGDLIYADNPLDAEVALDDGTVWRNRRTEAKEKVAETLDDFRGNFLYNLTDDHVRALLAEVPVIQQWDDHEVVNNWYPGEQLRDDDRYTVKDVDTLAGRARTAFFECNPVRPHPTDPARIHRKISYGPLLDLFVIDLRSYRGPNTRNRQTERGPDTAFLGEDQLSWLKSALAASQATWKIVCTDMPLGLVVKEWQGVGYEAWANGDPGPALGRELELAELLRFIAREGVSNVHFITADVHYCASHHYDPARAACKDFAPFWEFVSGPLHAGNFGPNPLDRTFGPEVRFSGIPDDLKPNRPPSDGYQFFGEMAIDGETAALTVRHFNAGGEQLWETTLEPA